MDRSRGSMVNLQIVFYSMYGHVYRLAEAIAEGAQEVQGVQVGVFQVPELVPDEILQKSGAKQAQAAFAHIPVARVEQLGEADAIIFGTPTRFGNMCAQMRNFLDQCGGLWARGAFINKIGSVFASTGTQHGGQETTITSFHLSLIHLGMIIVGTPYSEARLTNMEEISGGTPYGATTLSGVDGRSRAVSENELAIARFQGRHIASIARRFKSGPA
jgi:NAD(P)H:quinone oxidoreductase type IV